jgi:hypothetical protein
VVSYVFFVTLIVHVLKASRVTPTSSPGDHSDEQAAMRHAAPTNPTAAMFATPLDRFIATPRALGRQLTDWLLEQHRGHPRRPTVCRPAAERSAPECGLKS